jgi:DNA-binding GntR family transcriptional regulator
LSDDAGGALSELDSGEIGKAVTAYERIRNLVVEGLVRPRQRLNPATLAGILHVSATPVREALARLASEGYISWEAHRGYFAKLLSVAEQQDLYCVLFMLQRGCVEHDIASFTAAGLEIPLASRVDDASDGAYELALVARAHVAFSENLQQRIAALSGNLELRRMVGLILNRTHLVRVVSFEDDAALAALRRELFELSAALQAHEPGTVIALLQANLQRTISELPSLVERANARALGARSL